MDSRIRRELGVGLIYTRELDSFFDGSHPVVGVVELEPQTLWEKVADNGEWSYRPNEALLDRVAALPLAKLMHGIGQPVGGAVPDTVEHFSLLKAAADQLQPAWVSEHLSFNRVAIGEEVAETGFLLPPRQDAASVRVAAWNVSRYGYELGRPVAFETGVNYLRPRYDEMTDGEFWRAVAERADSGILLDLHNVWCNELNGRYRVRDVIDQLPLERIWEMHLAGGMPMSGYWLDAHSDRIPRQLIELAAEVIPRLPNLGALMFELLPEHFEKVGIDGVNKVIAELAALWELRRPSQSRPDLGATAVSRPTPAELAEVREWETSLYWGITDRENSEHQPQVIVQDPGIDLYRELVADFRRGGLAQTLHHTMTMLLLGLGGQGTAELLNSFFSACSVQMYRAVEADNFCRFLLERPDLLRRIRYLREVLNYEHALIKATVLGEDSQVEWTADPTAILQAVQRGQLPSTLPVVRSAMLISA